MFLNVCLFKIIADKQNIMQSLVDPIGVEGCGRRRGRVTARRRNAKPGLGLTVSSHSRTGSELGLKGSYCGGLWNGLAIGGGK